MLKIGYRSEIDGLRALGILGVLAYHLEIFINEKQLLPGGFLGVDIFFVVSGYLITSLLYEEYKIKGNFSLLNFYFRRAKRLLRMSQNVSLDKALEMAASQQSILQQLDDHREAIDALLEKRKPNYTNS